MTTGAWDLRMTRAALSRPGHARVRMYVEGQAVAALQADGTPWACGVLVKADRLADAAMTAWGARNRRLVLRRTVLLVGALRRLARLAVLPADRRLARALLRLVGLLFATQRTAFDASPPFSPRDPLVRSHAAHAPPRCTHFGHLGG